jgi:hypothetical protein
MRLCWNAPLTKRANVGKKPAVEMPQLFTHWGKMRILLDNNRLKNVAGLLGLGIPSADGFGVKIEPTTAGRHGWHGCDSYRIRGFSQIKSKRIRPHLINTHFLPRESSKSV